MVGQTSQLAQGAITTPKARFLLQRTDLRLCSEKPETARPETYQNLIHNLKNRCSQSKARKHSRKDPPDVTQVKSMRNLFTSRVCHSPTEPLLSQSRSSLTARARWRHTGGDERDRTVDPLLAKQVLSQLSYAPSDWWAREDLNLRPHAYQACALTS